MILKITFEKNVILFSVILMLVKPFAFLALCFHFQIILFYFNPGDQAC